MNKKGLAYLILAIAIMCCASAYAQTTQANSLALKSGFNFISFVSKPNMTPADFKNIYYSDNIEELYTYSAASGSFLSVSEGTLTTFNVGCGYIIG